MNKKITKDYICAGISAALIEYGYPDATADKIATIYDQFKAGQRFPDLSYGVISGFAESHLKEIEDILREPLP